MLFEDAEVHSDTESGVERPAGRFRIHYSLLKPNPASSNSNCFIDVQSRFFASSKDVYKIDLLGHVGKPSISFLAKHAGFVGVDGYDAISV